MRKNLGAKPFIYPLPVLIVAAYDENSVANAMNAAWGTVADFNQVAIYLAKDHKTTQNILNTRAFTVSIADAMHIKEADYLGIVSGNKVPNKIENAGLHVVKSEFVNAPIIEEFSLTMECKMVSYDEEAELMIGEIMNVSANESILDEKDKIDVKKLNPLAYDTANHAYYTLGEKVGNAFSDGKELIK